MTNKPKCPNAPDPCFCTGECMEVPTQKTYEWTPGAEEFRKRLLTKPTEDYDEAIRLRDQLREGRQPEVEIVQDDSWEVKHRLLTSLDAVPMDIRREIQDYLHRKIEQAAKEVIEGKVPGAAYQLPGDEHTTLVTKSPETHAISGEYIPADPLEAGKAIHERLERDLARFMGVPSNQQGAPDGES